MSDQPEHYTATSYFNAHNIIKILNNIGIEFGQYLTADALSYLVSATDDDKRTDFRNFVRYNGPGTDFAIEAILEVVVWAMFLQNQESIETEMLKQDELLLSYIPFGRKLSIDNPLMRTY